ncbi:MAG TPA: DUF1294 domain-containing protein [Phycisphaerales bacterium]|nr:DUF1294 domain-containing protein [Phycisphaerales bacterium]
MYGALIGGTYAFMSLVTFAVFAIDKRRAIRDQWRISEKALLVLCFLFGWPGGLLAMKLVRHKTQKPTFRFGVPAIALLHLAGWIAVAMVAWS